MSKLLESFDKSLYRPVFQNEILRVERALQLTYLLNAELNELVIDYYVKIPHALSAIFYYQNQFRIDIQRSFDEKDPYIEEEALLAPPEAQFDRFWRRTSSRLTYLVSQLFFALLTGELPVLTSHTLLIEKLGSIYTSAETEALQTVIQKGLAKVPQKRYQNFYELATALEWLGKTLSISSAYIPTDYEATARNIPKMSRSFYQKAVTTKLDRRELLTSSPRKYEMQIWNPHYQHAARILIDTPARVRIGRKVVKFNNSLPKESSTHTQVEQKIEKQEGIYIYTLSILGDRCLSRKHAEIYLPSKETEKAYIEDLGSTHGIIVFRDRSRTLSSSVGLSSGGHTVFLCPEDQHLKLGNTYLRIRPVTEKSIHTF